MPTQSTDRPAANGVAIFACWGAGEGWSQPRYQRRVGNAHQEHAKEAMERLAQIVHDDNVSLIILAGDSVVIPLLVGVSV